jgi:hypothetical protein
MITAQLATIPEREVSCKLVVRSLLPQVDKIRIALNNFSLDGAFYTPDYLLDDKIEVVHCDNSIMDGFKFIHADTNNGYVVICDDDILYPPDFVAKMKWHLDSMSYPSVMSIMGKNLLPFPIESYAYGKHEFFRAFEYHSRLYEVDIIGMCGAIYHTSHIKINEKNMVVRDSDVCMSVFCRQFNIKKYVVPHYADWCVDLMQILPHDVNTMWLHNLAEKNDKIITEYINNNLRPLNYFGPNDDLGK